jgi:hypothetical protein
MGNGFRMLLGIVGTALLVFGFFCLNYTKAGTEERHKEFASRHGLPPPSRAIFYGGALMLAVGAGAVGYAAGRGSAETELGRAGATKIAER